MKPGVKKGDVVVYGKYSGTEVEIKNITHLIVRESELLGVIEALTQATTEHPDDQQADEVRCEARAEFKTGVEKLASAVPDHGPRGTQRRHGEVLWRPRRHQGRRQRG